MASTYTTNLTLEKPGIGEQDGDSGATLNSNFDTIDTKLAIKDEDNMASDSASHLSTQQSIKAYVDSQVNTEETIEDFVGGMVTGNTETGIAVTYEDSDGTLDFVVADTTVAGDSGSTGMTPGDTLTIAGGTNVTTAMSGDTLTVTSTDTNTQLTQEQVEDYVGGMLDGTATFIAVSYDDGDGNIDFVVPVKDEDNMASDSATYLSTQQSIKAYVDNKVVQTILTLYKYTATAGQTTFTGSDDGSTTLAYTAGSLFVTLNGLTLENGTDYTATNGTSVVLTDAATVSDELNIYAFGVFSAANVTGAGGDFSIADDLSFTSDAAIINMGADSDVTMTHVHNKGVQFNTQPIIPTPTFRACKVSSSQTFSDATYTKITFDATTWDIGGYYASDTYTPLVQGYYGVNVSLSLTAAVDTHGGLVAIYHNGGMTRFNRLYQAGITNDDFYITTFKFNGMIYMDGVDDTLEVYYYNYSEDGGDCVIGADSRATYFEAFLVSRSG